MDQTLKLRKQREEIKEYREKKINRQDKQNIL